MVQKLKFRRALFKDIGLNYPNGVGVLMPINGRNIASTWYKECFVCKWIVKTVKVFITQDNVTVAEVEHILDTICELCPKFIRDVCPDLVHKYYNLFAELIITVADEGQICFFLHLCEIKSAEAYVGAVMEANSNDALSERDTCTPCILLGGIMKSILENQDILQMVHDGFQKVCDKLPEAFKKVCNSELRTHWQDYINMLNNFRADQFCTDIKLCPNKLPETSEIRNTEKCGTCQIVAKMAKTMLANPDLTRTIKNIILNSCGSMTSDLKAICNFAINAYWDQVIDMLKTYNPLALCKEVKLCSSRNELHTFNISKDVCKILSNVLKSILENPDISTMIRDGINKACDKMPGALKNICHSELQTHWIDFLNMIRNFNAEQFCRNAKMYSVETELAMVKSDTCGTCKIAIQMLKTMIVARPDLARTIKITILNACRQMSPYINLMCNFAVNHYWNQFIIILKRSDPFKLCRQFTLCSNENELQTIDSEINIHQSCIAFNNLIKHLVKNTELIHDVQNALGYVCSYHRANNWCNYQGKLRLQELMTIFEEITTENFCKDVKIYQKYQEIVVAVAA